MVVSMTGFGRSKATSADFSVTVELKTVNHRFREYYIRMPRQLLKMEDKIKKVLNPYIARGRIEVYITLEGEGAVNRQLRVDWGLLSEYIETLEKIKETYELSDAISLKHLLENEELITVDEVDSGNEELETLVLDAVKEATVRLKDMRIQEGQELEKDMVNQVKQFEQLVEKLTDYAPQVVKQYEQKLRKKLTEYISEQIDESRLLTEVVFFADKTDINEELTRLRSHLQQFYDTINLSRPIGRKLDFLLQEMNREVNTIGSKANDALIGKEVVEMKSLLEKVKEQVQNIE